VVELWTKEPIETATYQHLDWLILEIFRPS